MNAYQVIVGNGIPPSILLISAGLLGALFTGKTKKIIYFAGVLFSILVIFKTGTMTGWIFSSGFTGEMIFGQVDRLSKIFAIIFSLITFAGLLYSIHSDKSLKLSSGLIYAGGAMGVVYAGDFFTLYIFWEIMAVASTFLVLDGNTEKSLQAAFRYIMIHIAGGLFLLAGIIIHVIKTGSYEIAVMSLDNIEGSLIFVGIAVNAAIFPVHAWLKDAYPEASPEGSVFLSAFTTKSAVYLFARVFSGTDLLIYGGLLMATIPLIYALIEDDIRRTLAYCLINQVGFMLVAIGLGTELGINGASAHAFSHILYKALLFMTAGAVIYRTGRRNFSELGGLYRYMPYTAMFAIIAAMSVSMPFFCGYASKSLIITAVEEEHMKIPWLLLEFGSAGVFIAAGVRFVYSIFFGESIIDEKVEEAPSNMIFAMFFVSLISILVGTSPELVYSMLPYKMEEVHLFTPQIIIPKLQLLMFAVLGYYFIVRFSILPKDSKGDLIDTDIIYVKAAQLFYILFNKVLNSINTYCDKLFIKMFVPFISKTAISLSTNIYKLVLIMIPSNNPEKKETIDKIEEYEDKAAFPIGLNAAATILFLAIFFLIASNSN